MDPVLYAERTIRGVWSMAKRLQNHRRAFAVLLLVFAAFQAWTAHSIFSRNPFLALANAAMALILVLGVILTW